MNHPQPNNVTDDHENGSSLSSSDAQVESDGVIAPSSQRTQRRDASNESYKSELNRRNSFAGFPQDSPVKPNDLARAGFYYFGVKDMVRCFSCSIRVENWMVGDHADDARWHKNTCDFMNGQECGNIPIHDLDGRLATFGKFPPGSPISHQYLAEFGFFFTRVSDRIECFFCGKIVENWKDKTDFYCLMGHNEGCSLVNSNSAVPVLPPPQPHETESVSPQLHKVLLDALHLQYEFDRLASFSGWQNNNVSPSYFARNGFFYLGNSDEIQCFSCSKVLRGLDRVDNIAQTHCHISSVCKMACGVELRNVAVPRKEETVDERTMSYQCRYPSNPQMCYLEQRLQTFKSWPVNHVVAAPSEIAEAGLYYSGGRDCTKCWYCDGGLVNWEMGDIPWVEHARWFPHCEFVLQKKGQVFVYRQMMSNPGLSRLPCRKLINAQNHLQAAWNPRQVIGRNSVNALHKKKISDLANDLNKLGLEDELGSEDLIHRRKEKKVQEVEETFQQENPCRVCWDKKRELVFVPCGHFCCCEGCASQLKECPVCRCRITERIKLYT